MSITIKEKTIKKKKSTKKIENIIIILNEVKKTWKKEVLVH